MTNTRKDYTILNIEDHISEDPNAVVDFVFSKLRPEQISYWRRELKKHVIFYSNNPCSAPTICDPMAYHYVVGQMVRRYWIDKYHQQEYIWILLKAALFCGISLGFCGGPNYANRHIEALFEQDKMNQENIYL